MAWIKVTDQLPDDGTTVLVHQPESSEPVWFGYLEAGDWYDPMGVPLFLEITHWQHLPDPPGETAGSASPPFQACPELDERGEGQGGDGVPTDPEEVLP